MGILLISRDSGSVSLAPANDLPFTGPDVLKFEEGRFDELCADVLKLIPSGLAELVHLLIE